VAQWAADGVEAGGAGVEMHSNPKFWALTVAFFILLYLAAINIVVKINMLLHLAENG
jgi:heme/copper-type cytochrome/quinol oxidase subunit 4